MFDWAGETTAESKDRDRPARVAVITVHGVADPQPDESNASIADLLTNIDDLGPAYGPFVKRELQIPVRGLPIPDRNRHQIYDFDQYVTQTGRQVHRERGRDAGLVFMASLLACYTPDGADGVYHTTVVRSRRHAPGPDGRARVVDIFEMYWAEYLSRVGGGLTRVFAEFCQLLFHIESLGAHAVRAGQAAEATERDAKWWRRWALTQRWAASFLTREILLFNLFLAGLMLAIPGGLVDGHAAQQLVAASLSVSAAAGVAIVSYRTNMGAPPAAAWSFLAAVAVWVTAQWSTWPAETAQRALTTLLLAVSSAAIFWIMTAYEHHRPGVRGRGSAYGVTLLTLVLLELWITPAPGSAIVSTTLHGVEIAYAALWAFWAVFLLLSWCAFIFGKVIVGQATGIVAVRLAALNLTARFTLAVPAVLFLLTSVAWWAGLSFVIGQFNAPQPGAALGGWLDQSHAPLWVTQQLVLSNNEPQTIESVTHALLLSAAGPALGLIVMVVASSLFLVLLGIAPSALAEVRPPRQPRGGKRNGLWLNGGFQLAKLAGRLVIASMLVLLPAGFIISAYAHSKIDPGTWQQVAVLWNERVLRWFGGALTGFVLGMLLFGDRLRVLSLGLRNGLDAILDVDNYLREHPRTATPRARICTRFASVLRHVYAQDYDAVVIVAESQGAVIAAELLRFIKLERLADADSTLVPGAGTRLVLFTMGAPLRQAYGLRFPHLYRWARHDLTAASTAAAPAIAATTYPDPDELGVSLWVNAYRSGDYIGRNLWRPDDTRFLFNAPEVSAVLPLRAGPFPVSASESAPPTNRREFCIGAGGHTHYRDCTAPQIALELDALIRGYPG